VIGQLWGTLELEEPVPVVDIGGSGALLASTEPLVLDSRHALQLTIKGDVISVNAQVRHMRHGSTADPAPYLVGVEFLDLPAVVAHAIEQDDPAVRRENG
jgi:hypothetical protein